MWMSSGCYNVRRGLVGQPSSIFTLASTSHSAVIYMILQQRSKHERCTGYWSCFSERNPQPPRGFRSRQHTGAILMSVRPRAMPNLFGSFVEAIVPELDIDTERSNHEVAVKTIQLRSLVFRLIGTPEAVKVPDPALPFLYILLLSLDSGNLDFQQQLSEAVSAIVEKESRKLSSLRSGGKVPPMRLEELQAQLRSHEIHAWSAIEQWCKDTISESASFSVMKPLLASVLNTPSSEGCTPNPTLANIRGKAVEQLAATLIQESLPADWHIYTGAHVLSVEDTQLNDSNVKLEFDMVVVDSDSTIQWVVEVKSAENNPIAAVYKDITKLDNIVDAVAGKLVEFIFNKPTKTKVKLLMSENPNVAYVLGTNHAALDISRSERLLRSIELLKLLSDLDNWSEACVTRLENDCVVFNISDKLFQLLNNKIQGTLTKIRHRCTIFLLPMTVNG